MAFMDGFPCVTDGCEGVAADGRPTCDACHDRNGFPEGYSRSRDEAWLAGKTIPEIRFIPLPGPGCNSHPVTPRPDFCLPCRAVTKHETTDSPDWGSNAVGGNQ